MLSVTAQVKQKEEKIVTRNCICLVPQSEENARKERMNQRIMKQYEDAIKKHKAGKPVDFDELPTPPGMSETKHSFFYYLSFYFFSLFYSHHSCGDGLRLKIQKDERISKIVL